MCSSETLGDEFWSGWIVKEGSVGQAHDQNTIEAYLEKKILKLWRIVSFSANGSTYIFVQNYGAKAA